MCVCVCERERERERERVTHGKRLTAEYLRLNANDGISKGDASCKY